MKKLLFKYGVNEKPKTKTESTVLGIQHVFAMFGSTILVPTLVGIDVATALVTAGIGTLIYTQVTSKKVPVFIGSSFAYIAILSSLNESMGPAGVSLAVLSVGIIYCIIAFIIGFIGTNWIDNILPPVVIGPIIIVIGLGLAPVAIANSGFSAEAFDLNNIIISMSALIATISALLIGNKQMKMIPVIFGIITGYVVALFLGVVDVS
ncbi:MAG: solute carrier family 23 protein, partial [Mycoplasmatales bacterium]